MEIVILTFICIISVILCFNINFLFKSVQNINSKLTDLSFIIERLNKTNNEIHHDVQINNSAIDGVCDKIHICKHSIENLSKCISIIAGWEVKLKNIESVISHNQSLIVNNKNMIEETRNAVKASKPRKTSKANNSKVQEKSLNSKVVVSSQTAKSINSDANNKDAK